MPDTEMAELKQIIGQLWKSVDSFKLSTAEADHKTQQQLAEWTQINLQLLELLAEKTTETTRLAQNYEQLTNCLNRSDHNWHSLNQQISGLSNTLKQFKPDNGLSHNQLAQIEQSLKAEVRALKQQINQQTQQLTESHDRPTWKWTEYLYKFAAITTVLNIAYVSLSGYFLYSQIAYIQKRSAWIIIKLQRLEKQ
jgi:chromosome segregation ATPase